MKKTLIFLTIFSILVIGGGAFIGISYAKKTAKQTPIAQQSQNQQEKFTTVIQTQSQAPTVVADSAQVQPVETKDTEVKPETKTEEKKEEEKVETKSEPQAQPVVKEPEPVQEKRQVSAPNYSAPFQWGVTMRPNAIGNYSAASWQDQLNKAKDLGVGWVRLDWDRNATLARNTAVIDAVKSNGKNVLLVVDYSFNNAGNTYQDGLNDGKTIGSNFKNKIDYYQLANEGGATSIKSPTGGGTNPSDYDDGKYEKVKEYMRGLSEGLDATDPSTTKIVTISWTHVGFVQRLLDDGMDFDMIGVDWYSWMGNFSSRRINDNETLFERLKTFGKPLAFMEVNILPEAEDEEGKRKTIVDEDKQSDFIEQLSRWSWNNRDWFKGFYVLELVDNINVPGEYVDYYGLVKASRSASGAGVIGDVRKAFETFRDIINNP